MLRRILIPLDSSPYSLAALNWGCYAAKRTDAELTGLAVLDIPGIERSVGSVPAGGVYFAQHLVEKREDEALEHVEKLLKNFEERCKRDGIKYRIAERQGNPSDEIIRSSIYHDLIVAGLRNCYHFEREQKPDESVEKILDKSVTPILAVPDRFEIPKGKIKVLIAFNASLPSSRAMHRFAQLVRTAEFKIKLIMSDSDMDYAQGCLAQAEEYLRAHGFDDIEKVWTPRNIYEEIRDQHLADANLIVIGAHLKKGIADFMVSSLMKHLLREENKSLLIGQ
jgi:nucleotide-binding universal stress UspA family protein